MQDPIRRNEFEKFFNFCLADHPSSTDIVIERHAVRRELEQLMHLLKHAQRKADQERRNTIEDMMRRLWRIAEEFDRLPLFQD